MQAFYPLFIQKLKIFSLLEMLIRFLISLMPVVFFLGVVGCAQNSGSPSPEPSTAPPQTNEQDNSLIPPTVDNPNNEITGTWLNDGAGKYAKYKVSIGPKYTRFSTICLFEKGPSLEASVKFLTEMDSDLLVAKSGTDTKYDNNRTCYMSLNRGIYSYRVFGNRLELALIDKGGRDVFSSQNYRKIE